MIKERAQRASVRSQLPYQQVLLFTRGQVTERASALVIADPAWSLLCRWAYLGTQRDLGAVIEFLWCFWLRSGMLLYLPPGELDSSDL